MPVSAGVDLTDEQHMIARGMKRVMTAFKPRRAALDQRRASRSHAMCDSGEAIGVRPRKPARKLYLIMSEDIDHVALRAFEHRQAARSARKTPDDERRIE